LERPWDRRIAMAIAKRLRKHLERAGVPYDVIKHRPTVSASKTA
jgi:hypothetical protein